MSIGTGALATNALGSRDRLGHLLDRVALIVNPPPDREIAPLVEVTRLPTPEPAKRASKAARSTPTPRPPRKPVNVKLHVNPRKTFISQQNNHWCAVAGMQIVLAMHKRMDNLPAAQSRLAATLNRFESRRDSHNGGWGPAAMAEALAANGVKGYEVRAYRSRPLALRDAARALSLTKAPVILIAWRGAHTWVMTGYRANADPTIFNNAIVTGTYIYDPWYPRISTIWGPSDPPGTFQNQSEMKRNYLRWQRPEGSYAGRDGKFIAIVPTIPLKKQLGHVS